MPGITILANDYFQDSNQITMPMLVANLKSGYSVDYGMLMLGVLICTLPTAIIFLCLQKEFCQWNCRSSEIMNRKYCLDKKNGEAQAALLLAKTVRAH